MNRRKIIAVLLYATVGWIIYRATMLIGYVPTISRVPFFFEIVTFLVFVVISYIYFKKFNYTTPLQTAAIFVSIVVVGDFIVIALSRPGALRFYASVPQVWLRFALIFLPIYLTGLLTTEDSDAKAHGTDFMGAAKRKFSLQAILITFCVILFIMVEISNDTNGAHADAWILPIIMAVIGLIGAIIGAVLGGIIGLIGKLSKKNIFILGMKYGAAIGFMLLIAFWYLRCLRHGTAVCLPQ